MSLLEGFFVLYIEVVIQNESFQPKVEVHFVNVMVFHKWNGGFLLPLKLSSYYLPSFGVSQMEMILNHLCDVFCSFLEISGFGSPHK